jgi:hypothetical protein
MAVLEELCASLRKYCSSLARDVVLIPFRTERECRHPLESEPVQVWSSLIWTFCQRMSVGRRILRMCEPVIVLGNMKPLFG